MKFSVLFLRGVASVFAATLVGAFVAHAETRAEKPNFVFIFADDLSYEALGSAGRLDIDTPHLDRLAERGTVFTNAYNMGAWNGAVCVASRTMLNTGSFVWKAMQTDLAESVSQGRFWSQQMKEAGYDTYMTGKWHVKANAAEVFDEALNVRKGMPNQTPEGYNRPKDPEDYEQGWKPWETKYGGFWEGGTHWSEVVANDSLGFIDKASRKETPFFMYLAFSAAHDPRQSPKEYVDRYPLDRIEMPENFLPEYPYADQICGKKLRDEKLAPYPRTEYSVKVNRQEYFALITHMDDQIGRILDGLEEAGVSENTYIVFTADHGLSVGHHGLIGKQNMYDDSVRVPFFIVGPDVEAGRKIETPIYLQDVMPTALEVAGIEKPDYVDFKSVLPLLRGEVEKSYDAIYGSYIDRQRMVTKDGWKLIHYPTVPKLRLFNLEEDPEEMNDLAENPEYASVLKRMRKELDALNQELGDPYEF
ncbi:sulfatase-like hydrolase/transferase [Pelagicoccus sp. SDUM812005]|uniref:sulfatase-like hydrolase/transferase n=1 Tax=Pelagicoccus sp. SDUM812005 TaxID=3041257 RepID=UPI00280E979E|nr:sulfatase-like hydrolase/transferase [Pelagicoccus sp. SDUM812005]MDQ8181586.1 sulfatase-like hydrolase/transferase [Pelagicoccus sp. SDUM812005]